MRFSRYLSKKMVATIFTVIGLAVYASGLNNPFMGDDAGQIVDNPAVHSFKNVVHFFNGGTMYSGAGETQLAGTFYRPIMTTSYSILYSLFGLNPLPFHLFQLVLFIYGAFMVFVVLRYFVSVRWSFISALIFLVHPLNSQAVFSIPTLQEPLYFGFGITALWLILRFPSWRVLPVSLMCLFLSLLSKETGILFIAITLFYLALFDRWRLPVFAGGAVIMTGIYLALKIHAVGLLANAHIAPISELSFIERIVNIPAVIAHYLGLFIFPVNLASSYYWVHSIGSFQHFWLPLLCLAGLCIFAFYLGYTLRQNISFRIFITYVFFIGWVVIGLSLHLQIIPLDMSACDTWFYLPMVGLLGALSLVAEISLKNISYRWVYAIVTVIVIALGIRTSVRGHDWNGNTTLALADLKSTPGNYVAQYQLASYFRDQGDYDQAEALALQSIRMHPTGSNWDVLGKIYMSNSNYPKAKQAFEHGLKTQPLFALYKDSAALSILYEDSDTSLKTLTGWSKTFSRDMTIWAALAAKKYRTGDIEGAKVDIERARRLSPKNATITLMHEQITKQQPLSVQ